MNNALIDQPLTDSEFDRLGEFLASIARLHSTWNRSTATYTHC